MFLAALNDQLTLAIVVGGFSFGAAALSLVASLVNRHKIDELHLTLNSRLTELIKATQIAAHAEGVAAGAEQQKRRAISGDTGQPEENPDAYAAGRAAGVEAEKNDNKAGVEAGVQIPDKP